MTYRIICVYRPHIGTFRRGRGAWRVQSCYNADVARRLSPVQVIHLSQSKLLCINSLRPRQVNSWCNPRSILAEWLGAAR